MNSPGRHEPQDSAEDLLQHDLQTFISVGSRLDACPMLPWALRDEIDAAVRAARGCSVCHQPLGATHSRSCTLGAIEGGRIDTVRHYDLEAPMRAPALESEAS